MSDQERHYQTGTMPEPLCRNIETGSETLRMPDSDVDEIVADNADVAGIRIGERSVRTLFGRDMDKAIGRALQSAK